MIKKEIREELEHLIKLLQLEKEADLKQYSQRMTSTSLAERRKNGVCWYPISIEKTNYTSTEHLVLKISRNQNHNGPHLFQSGKMVNFFSNAQGNPEDDGPISGVVNQVNDYDMIITLNADDMPDWAYDGKLGIQLLFDENSYREMEKGLASLLKDTPDRMEELVHIILGQAEPHFSDIEPVHYPELNEGQNLALNQAIAAKDLAIVHGPPGTGKTTTLIQAITHTLKTENQILVCAPSNAAVDLLAEKLGEHQIDVVRIGHPARVTEEIWGKTLDIKITRHKQYKELKSLHKNAHEYFSLGKKYKRNFGPEEREQRKLLLSEAKKIKVEANLLSKYIKEDILNKTRVICSTLVGAMSPVLEGKHFSTVFIDEAAQGLEPACWLPVSKADRVIFAGDHCQLPPTIKSFEAANAGLGVTLFEKAIQRNKAGTLLTTQYRMHKDIMEFPSRHFYGNQLHAHNEVENRSIFPDDQPIEFIDTAGCGFFEQTNPESKSSMNPEEMDILFKHLQAYMDSAIALNIQENIANIGIISPYKAQVNLIQENIKNLWEGYPSFKKKIVVNTIDSFQGQERDIVYISLVRSNEKNEIGFLNDIRRMNVAMTRARKKLVIIGDSATIGSFPFYSDFLDYINEKGAYHSAYELLYS
jgi:ATP-dependent RNA/DNA helicase IGHMBP2